MTGADDSEIALSATRPSSAIPGIAVIALAVALPAITYVGGLGFYSDDWAFIHLLHSAPDQSSTGIYRELAKLPNVAVRPGQIVWYAVFDGLKPGEILAVHVANHVVFALGGVIPYLALRSLGSLGGCAFTIALIYAWAACRERCGEGASLHRTAHLRSARRRLALDRLAWRSTDLFRAAADQGFGGLQFCERDRSAALLKRRGWKSACVQRSRWIVIAKGDET